MSDAKSMLMSGVPELLILRLLAEEERYGYELARAIRTVTREAIALGEGVLYPALHSLEHSGLLRARRQPVAGRVRVYYSITPKGRRRLEQLTANWRRVSTAVEAALAEAHPA
jgi:PadR family transcriptional regulator, regulatory protein PadR